MKRFLALSALLALSVLEYGQLRRRRKWVELLPPIRKRERFSSPERMRRFRPW